VHPCYWHLWAHLGWWFQKYFASSTNRLSSSVGIRCNKRCSKWCVQEEECQVKSLHCILPPNLHRLVLSIFELYISRLTQ
jgi:hypothetical protein